MNMKQVIAPMQAYQVDLIGKRVLLFDSRMKQYRSYFLNQRVRYNYYFCSIKMYYNICSNSSSARIVRMYMNCWINRTTMYVKWRNPMKA